MKQGTYSVQLTISEVNNFVTAENSQEKKVFSLITIKGGAGDNFNQHSSILLVNIG